MKVHRSGECWEWEGSLLKNGYGQFGLGGRGEGNGLAHRVAWELIVGPIPDDQELDHTCHTRKCVRPAHLRLVTKKQNQENRAGTQRNNKSGIRGVCWDNRGKKWIAYVSHNGKHIRVGSFDSREHAQAAVVAKRLELFTHNDLDRIA